jgi:hypothetical protein
MIHRHPRARNSAVHMFHSSPRRLSRARNALGKVGPSLHTRRHRRLADIRCRCHRSPRTSSRNVHNGRCLTGYRHTHPHSGSIPHRRPRYICRRHKQTLHRLARRSALGSCHNGLGRRRGGRIPPRTMRTQVGSSPACPYCRHLEVSGQRQHRHRRAVMRSGRPPRAGATDRFRRAHGESMARWYSRPSLITPMGVQGEHASTPRQLSFGRRDGTRDALDATLCTSSTPNASRRLKKITGNAPPHGAAGFGA